jgi:predicted Rossmann fold nucleotide-binding protein DprA/Smf involved in DNA uptake
MKTVIAGSRTITDKPRFLKAIAGFPEITSVVCGMAPGVDALGLAWALDRGLPVERYPADWKAHGRAAGPIRNRQMALVADMAVVFWDGESRGSLNMIEEMRLLGKPVSVIRFDRDEDR